MSPQCRYGEGSTLLPRTALASPALDEVGYIARHAGGCSSYMEWLTHGGACKSLPQSKCADVWEYLFPDRLLPKGGLTVGSGEMDTDQEVAFGWQ